jgi:hypothetical protein
VLCLLPSACKKIRLPDEIESHPDPASVSPFEDWKYYRVAGTGGGGYFTFIDRTGRGDYRLAPSTAK